MSVLRHLPSLLAIVALPASCVLAQDRPALRAVPSAESFKAVMNEYQDVMQERSRVVEAAYELAKKNGKEKQFKFNKPLPFALFSPRFLAIAEMNPEGPEAIDALKMTLQTSQGPRDGTALETRAKAIIILRDHYAAKPAIKAFLKTLIRYSDQDSKALLAEVIARNPDRKVQAAVYKEQIAYREDVVRMAGYLKDPKRREGREKEYIEDRSPWPQGPRSRSNSSAKRFASNTAICTTIYPPALRRPS